jgi:hypothetical protein
MGLAKGCGGFFWGEPQYQVGFQNAAKHVAVDHEGKPSEHLLFPEFAGAPQNQPYTVREMDVVRHENSA